MIGHNKQQPLVDSSTQQRIRPPLPTPNQIQFNQTGSLYIPGKNLLSCINCKYYKVLWLIIIDYGY